MSAPIVELLVDSLDYTRRLSTDLASARESIVVSALSFEGDAAGTWMAERLLASPAADRRVLIDAFTKHVVNDRVIWTPSGLLDGELWREVRATSDLVRRLRANGVGVDFSGPPGPFLSRLPARNHKKLVSIDDRVAYVGGINFSDHNFLWHDLMLRIEEPALVRCLRDDFDRSFSGHARRTTASASGVEIVCLDGETNEAAFAPVLALIDAAKGEIFLECPYVTEPFLGRLAAARRRGVRVTVVTPWGNNAGFCRKAMELHSARSGFDVRFYPGRMTHMKALLVDGRTLVTGSANFDALSYRFQQEYIAIVTDARLVEDFRKRVMEEDLRRSEPCRVSPGPLSASVTRGRIATIEAISVAWRSALGRRHSSFASAVTA